jgi:hypothetical protein
VAETFPNPSSKEIIMKRQALHHGMRWAAPALCILATAIIPVLAENANPGIIPPHANPFGKSYSEWSAMWWQWAMCSPVGGNPLYDTTGSDAAKNQPGKVWFLAGMWVAVEAEPGHYVAVAERTISVPNGTALFFPILNAYADNVGVDPPLTTQELGDQAAAIMSSAGDMSCVIDGRPVEGLADFQTSPYRARAAGFSFWLPPSDNIYQNAGVDFWGTVFPAAADGVYLMLAPLNPGEHTVHFKGQLLTEQKLPYFTLDVSYKVNFTHGPKQK